MLGRVASMPDGGDDNLPQNDTASSGNSKSSSVGRRCLGEARPRDQQQSREQQRLMTTTENRMAKDLERGGIPGWSSYLTFSWAGHFLMLGSMVTLKEEHLEEIHKHHESRYLCDRLTRNWQRERATMEEYGGCTQGRRKGVPLLRALLATFKWRLVLSGVCLVGESALHITQAIALGWLVAYFDDANAASWEGWVYACAVVISGMAFSCFYHHFFFEGTVLGMQLRSATTTILYDKILRLRFSSLGEISTGHLINLASADIERFQLGGLFVNFLWKAPLESLVILYLGVNLVGVSFLAGFAALALMVPMQGCFSRKFASVRQRVTTLTDERVKLTNQAVAGARLMKMNGWEPALEKEIQRVRAEEVRVLLHATLLRAINEALFFVQPAVLGCLVFTTYHLLGNVLTPQKVFTTLALLNITQFTMGKYLYQAVQNSSESWVSIKRLEAILLMDEKGGLTSSPMEDAKVGTQACDIDIMINNNDDITHTSGVLAKAPDVGSSEAPKAAANSASRSSPATPTPVVSTGGTTSAAATTRRTAKTTTTTKKMSNVSASRGRASEHQLQQPGLVLLQGVSFRWTTETEKQLETNHTSTITAFVKIKGRGRATAAIAPAGAYPDESARVIQPDQGGLTLDEIDLRIEPGQLVGVVGAVGSSKTSLLMAIMKEMTPITQPSLSSAAAAFGDVSGEGNDRIGWWEDELDVSVQGSLAYASQEPWIQSGTLRENILFGRPMDRKRYDAVIRDCALGRDLYLLPSGDETEIGSRGVNLSGGQKARVGLARMAYGHADIYLMDDPLSAVDPAVGRELFSKVVCERLCGSTRILVTHQVHHLSDPAVDKIIVMNNGKIAATGSFEELEASGSFSSLGDPSPTATLRPINASAGDTAKSETGTSIVIDDFSKLNLRHNSDSGSSEDLHDAAQTESETGPDSDADVDSPSVVTLKEMSQGLYGEPYMGHDEEAKEGAEQERMGGERDRTAAAEAEAPPEAAAATALAPTAQELAASLAETAWAAEEDEWVGRLAAANRSQSKSSLHCLTRAGSLSMSRLSCSRAGSLAIDSRNDSLARGIAAGVRAPGLVVAEDRESGGLKRSTYWEYVKEATGLWQVLLIFLSMAGGQVLMMSVTVWLARWSRESEEEQERVHYVVVLILLAMATVVVSHLRAVLAFFGLVKASHRLHDRMLKRVIRAPVLFFDSNPVGRILNRFTKDIHFMDDLLPMTLYDFIVCSFMVVGGTSIVLVVNPWVLLSMIPALGYFRYLLRFSMKTSREVKRLEAVTRSPVYSLMSETLDGLVTIRAFGMQERFLKQFMERVDLNTRAYFAWVYVTRWLGFRLDVVVAMVLTASCFFSVALNEFSDSVDPGLLGAALVYVLQLGGLFQWSVRQSAEVENQMVSAERVLGYCRVAQEANLESVPEFRPKASWPGTGSIEIQNVSMRYREDLPRVLKDLTLSISGGSRVGVVGRTGAGKSSLISALFRLVECDKGRGGIKIDGVDISTVGLHDLRRRMSVVPQTPFLFSGSMRLNLDPFAEKSDPQMWAALEAVQMKGHVQALPGGLDGHVAEGGSNLSVGQRQLLCLARAVLQRSQILVMDEATANIDEHTDSLIQDVVRTSFKGKTVIMVAHRLNTVIDCDQVVVISEGSIVEEGHPHLLLQAHGTPSTAGTYPSTSLSSMVEETGGTSATHLRRLAREAWEVLEVNGKSVA